MDDPDQSDDYDSADTQMFEAFVQRGAQEEAEPPRPVGVPFRLLTLLGGVVAFFVLVFLLLKL